MQEMIEKTDLCKDKNAFLTLSQYQFIQCYLQRPVLSSKEDLSFSHHRL